MLVTPLPPHVRHSGPAKVAVGPGAPWPICCQRPIYLHRTMIRWMACRAMVSGSTLCPAWLSPSVTYSVGLNAAKLSLPIRRD